MLAARGCADDLRSWFTMIMELVLRDPFKKQDNPETGGRGYCKIDRGRSDCWCTENTLNEPPEAGGQKHCGRRAVLWKEVLEFVRSKVCLDGNARYAIAHRSAPADKCLAKWRLVLSSSWLPRMLRLNTVKNYNVAGFSLEFERLDDKSKLKEPKIASWSARMVANVIGVKKPPWMEMEQWWRLAQDGSPMDREMQHERLCPPSENEHSAG